MQMLSESNKILLSSSQNISRKRNEWDLNESKSENINILSSSKNINLKSNSKEKNNNKKNYNKKYKKFLDKNNMNYYFYTDANDNEWQFKEINGTLNKYYFKGSTYKCNGFGMIDKRNENKVIILSKDHNIKYIWHTYYRKKNLCKKTFK